MYVNLKRMIELRLISSLLSKNQNLWIITQILEWFFGQVDATIKDTNPCEGYIVIKDKMGESEDVGALLLTKKDNPNSENDLLKILQQPPEKYKGKYVAHILSKEPDMVEEKQDDDEKNETGQIAIEIEET